MRSRSWMWLWALVAMAAGMAALVVVDLAEEPESSASDIGMNLLEELPLLLILLGAVLLYRSVQDQMQRYAQLQADLDSVRAQSEHWREQARTHLRGLSHAIDVQFTQWALTAAEREVALLLLKGMSTKEIANVRATSEKTVREQAHSLYKKARLSGRAELSAYFLEDLLAPATAGGSPS